MSDAEEVTLRPNIEQLLQERRQLLEEIQILKEQLLSAGLTPCSSSAKSAPDLTKIKRLSLPIGVKVIGSVDSLNKVRRRPNSCAEYVEKPCLSTYDKRSGTSDLGKQYEYIMCAYYAVKFATDPKISDFEMTTNHQIYGDFDDIALKVRYVDGSSHTYLLQLKHTENKKRLTESNLCTLNKDFSMMKYLKTFQKLEEHKNVSCILFTNRTAYFKEHSHFSMNDIELVVKKHDEVSCEDLLNTNQSTKTSIFQFTTVERNDRNKEISKFLDQFYLFANQYRVQKMTMIITSLIVGLLGRDVYNTFIHFMKNWWCGNFVLTKTDVVEKLSLLVLQPFTRHISDKNYNKRSQILTDAILKFDITLVRDCDIDIITQIWFDDVDVREVSLTALKYGLTNKGISNLDELSNEQRSNVLWYLNKVPLIIKVHESTKEQIRRVIKLLEKMEIRKKILLVGDFQKEDFFQWTVFDNLHDLQNDELFEIIIKTFQVSLQGRKPVSLDTLIDNEETSKIFTTKELFIMTQKPLLIGEKQQELPRSYISRSVSTNFLNTKKVVRKCVDSNELLVIIDSTLSFIDYLKNNKLRFSKFDENNIDPKSSIILAIKCTKKDFDNICLKTLKHRVHLIKILDDCSSILVLSSDNNLKNEDLRYVRDPIKEENIHQIFNNPINVLCAQPGIGKSTMIKYLDINCPPDYWSVRVNLRQFNCLLKEEPEEEEILLHFLELDGIRNKNLLEEIKLLFSQNRKIYLFLDGLDEIESNCIDFALDYVNYIASTGVHVWISSRQNLQQMITTNLNIFPIDIEELKQEERKNYVEKRLRIKYEPEEIDKISKEVFLSANVANSHNMLGIPLQLFIITENFLDDEQLYHRLHEEVFVLTKMYKIFFDGKKKHLYEKVGVQYEQQLGFNFIQYLENYEIPALRCCLDDNAFTSLKLEENSKNHEFLETIRNEGDKFGIITQINNEDKAVFAHQTFAEYFASLWLKKNFDKARILKKKFKSKKYQNLKLIFDIMLAENCPLHLAVIYRNSEQVKKHLSNIATKDEGGRTALHLICSYGCSHTDLLLAQDLFLSHWYYDRNDFNGESLNYRQIFKDLSQCNPFSIDEVFNWSCLDYCLHYQNLYPLEKFLDQYGDKIKLDSHFDNSNSLSIAYYASKLGYPNLLDALLKKTRSPIHYRLGEEKLSLLHVAVVGFDEDKKEPTSVDSTIKIIKILISYNIDIEARDANGATALHWAVSQGHKEIVKALLDNGADVSAIDNKEHTVIHYALEKWEKELTLFEIDNEIFNTSVRDIDGNTILHWSCKENNYNLTKKVLEKDININVKNLLGETALHHAVRTFKPNIEIIKLLIDNGIDINTSDCFGISPLHWAFDKGYYDIIGILHQKGANVTTITLDHKVTLCTSYKPLQHYIELTEMLIDYGFNVNTKNSEGVSVLHWVAQKGHLGIIKILLANGANVNALTNKKETVLHYVATSWNTKLIDIFREIEIDINSEDIKKTTPLHKAAEYGRFGMIRALLENGAKLTSVTKNGENILNVAVKTDEPNLTVIKFLLEEGVDVNKKDFDGISPLHWACKRGHCDVVKLLLEYGADINSVTQKGETSLHCASFNPDLIQLLLSNGINVNSKDVDGMTALHWASERGQYDLVKILIRSGADVNATNLQKETVLIYTLKQRKVNMEIIKLLLSSVSEVKAVDKNGMNALHWASENCHYEVVKLLLEKDIDVNGCSNRGETTLHYAARSWMPNIDIIRRLIQTGADVNARDEDKATALHWACKEGHYTNVEILVQLGGDIFSLTKNKETTLHFAARAWKNNESVIELLIDRGVDVNACDEKEKTALHWASEKGFYDNVKLLLNRGSYVNAVTSDGLTALHLAVYGGHVKIIKLLIEQGLDIDKVEAKNTNLPLYFAIRNGRLKEDLLVMMAATIREKFPLLSWTRYSYQEVITYLQEAQPYLESSPFSKRVSSSQSEHKSMLGSLQQLFRDNVGSYAVRLGGVFNSLSCKRKRNVPRTPTFIVHYPVFPTEEICRQSELQATAKK